MDLMFIADNNQANLAMFPIDALGQSEPINIILAASLFYY